MYCVGGPYWFENNKSRNWRSLYRLPRSQEGVRTRIIYRDETLVAALSGRARRHSAGKGRRAKAVGDIWSKSFFILGIDLVPARTQSSRGYAGGMRNSCSDNMRCHW